MLSGSRFSRCSWLYSPVVNPPSSLAANMQYYVRFGMIIRLEGENNGSYQKTARHIHEELEKNFIMAFPMIIQEGVMVWQLVVRSLFEIDPAMKKIESLSGVKGTEVFIPFKADLYRDWLQREIDDRVKQTRSGLQI